MNKSTYRFLIVALLAFLVLFIVSGQFKIVLQSVDEDKGRTMDTDVDELGSNSATAALNPSPIGFEYNTRG
jgi:hypothetical protein